MLIGVFSGTVRKIGRSGVLRQVLSPTYLIKSVTLNNQAAYIGHQIIISAKASSRIHYWLIAFASVLLACWSGFAAASNYVYDANGRLIAVTAPNGSAAVYNYDAVGNILSIQSIAIGQLALFSFNPLQGFVGTQVTIQGNGFSTTISNNTVKFNGTVATVTTAVANQLVVSVPSGATTGPISVTVAGTTVTSSNSFTVTGPMITGFTPAVGSTGTVVTVSGNGLEPVPGSTSATLGGVSLSLSSISNSQFIFSVPSNVTGNYAASLSRLKISGARFRTILLVRC